MSHWARAARILAGLHDNGQPDRENIAVRLVLASRDALPVTGVGLSWVTPHGPGATLAATDGPARLIEELQFSLGEGPCVDSSRSGFPVLQADLARTAATLWPTFGPRALAAGIAAVFAFPLQVGAVRMGVLDLYRDVAGPLADGDLDEALAYADAATAVLLELQARSGEDTVHPYLLDSLHDRAEVHQASGMISVQLGVRPADALTVLRARAYASDRSMIDLARAVITHKLRFDD